METSSSSAPRSGRFWRTKADFLRPFKVAASEAGQNIALLYDPALPHIAPDEPDLQELNASLAALADVFPDVQPEVFREMLTSLSDDSRLQLVTEFLLQKKAKWVGGRWVAPRKDVQSSKVRKRAAVTVASAHPPLDACDLFRSESYKKAVKQVFYQEFRNLSHSAIKAVLAEQNFSYTLARPILQELSARSWRFSLATLWSKRPPTSDAAGHPFITWRIESGNEGPAGPALKRTGDGELDRELYDLFVAPILAQQAQDRVRSDHAAASELNEAEAREAGAMFDCECCYGSVAFEEIAVCSDGGHILCLECIRRTVNEALYGQGWARTVDLTVSTIRCFAPTPDVCHGNIDPESLRHALDPSVCAQDHWHEFQSRLTGEALVQSGFSLQRCPFCDYAEVDEVPPLLLREKASKWLSSPATTSTAVSITCLLLSAMVAAAFTPVLLLLPLLGLVVLSSLFLPPLLEQSWGRVYKRRRGFRFRCQAPDCLTVSCMRCAASWTDPHVCFDSAQTSLRTAIEASATAAIKRTCPKCMLSFVKSSGCNKLVCNCGYTMCYVCRQEVTSREGYAHFCQHFRPNGGRCIECERCDLYGDEDEDAAIRQAAEAAEKAWRENEGHNEFNAEANRAVMDAMIGKVHEPKWYERWLDTAVNTLLT